MARRITNFVYEQDLHLLRKKKGEGKLFYVDADYLVSFNLGGTPTELTLPEGTPTDLASIPAIVPKWIASKVQAHLEAAVVHDYLYMKGMYTRAVCDEIFLVAMEAANVGWTRRHIMHKAVRALGWAFYKGGNGSP